MALYNLGQIRQQVAQMAGIQDSTGSYDMDATTYPTLDFANQMINDTFREVTSAWDYQFLETSKSYTFQHVISGVQSIAVTGHTIVGNTGTTGIVTPYPTDVLNYSWLGQNSVIDVNSNFSGISFTDSNGSACISTSGSVTTANWTGVGYVYQLEPDIDKFLAPGVVVAHSQGSNVGQGIVMSNVDYEDIVRMIPIGTVNASGTPSMYFQVPGLSPNNGIAIQFFPFPLPSYSGNNFIVNYKKKHVDLTDDAQVQSVIPEQWQNVIVQGVLEKVNSVRNPDRQEENAIRKQGLINSMKLWDAQQPSKVRAWRAGNPGGGASYLYDNSGWLTLGDGPGR
jgi:hypothetical protein